jgi:hypothetical protein
VRSRRSLTIVAVIAMFVILQMPGATPDIR